MESCYFSPGESPYRHFEIPDLEEQLTLLERHLADLHRQRAEIDQQEIFIQEHRTMLLEALGVRPIRPSE